MADVQAEAPASENTQEYLDDHCAASVLIYGPSKAGKSTLLCSGPGPVLLLDAEIRSKFLPFRKLIWSNVSGPPPAYDGSWDVCVVYVRDFGTVDRVYQWLHSGRHPFRSVVLDSVSEIQQRAVDQIAGTNQMTTPNWGELLRKVSKTVRDFRDLQAHPINPLACVSFTAMERVTQQGVHVPYLQGAIANVLAYYIDVVGYYGVKADDDGRPIRRLLLQPHPFYLAGDGTGRLPGVIEVPRPPGEIGGGGPVLSGILDMACDLSRPMNFEGAGVPDLAAIAADDLGADAPGGQEVAEDHEPKETSTP